MDHLFEANRRSQVFDPISGDDQFAAFSIDAAEPCVGGDHTFPYVSYHEIVKPTGSIPADFFKDQVVLIGRDVKASPDAESAQADLFATPFLASTGWLTPGAEVQA